jgi:AraC-like DNA-binding protein
MDEINITGVAIIAIFLVFILRKKNRNASDYFLALLNVFFAAFLISDIWVRSSLNNASFIFQSVLIFYMFPAFFTYALLLISPRHRLRKAWWWVWSMAFVFTVFIAIDFAWWHSYDATSLQKLYEYPPLIYHVFYKGEKVFGVICMWWLLKKIKHYQQRIRQSHSFIAPIDLSWLRNFTIVYMFIFLFSLITFLLYNFGVLQDIGFTFTLVFGFSVLAIFYLTINGIRLYMLAELQDLELSAQATQKAATKDQEAKRLETKGNEKNNTETINLVGEEAASNASNKPAEKYKPSSFSPQEMEVLYERLVQAFEQDTLYEQAQLQIQDVAAHLEVNAYKISQTINSLTGKPFYDFVNQYRVARFKELLTSPQSKQYTILALGIESGFNSKSSMNRIFKQHTGQSPREYQKTHSESAQAEAT